jgi:4-amino-4-deoxy-L-arabinose transferase-like glycosyltransferase
MTRLAPAALHARYREWLVEPAPRPVEPGSAAWIALAALAGFCGWWLAHGTAWWGLQSGDAHDYAALARRIAAGEGFTSALVFPAELDFGATADHPSLRRAPLWPLILAAGFRLGGVEPWVAHVLQLLFSVATVAAAAALAAALAGRAVGLAVGLVVAATPQLAAYGLDAISELPFACAVTTALLLMARRARGLWIGVACGLAYLLRYNGALLLPGALLVIAARAAPLRPLVGCALGFAAVASPWWIRNALVTGDPFFSLYDLALSFPPIDPGQQLRVASLPHTTSWYELEPRRAGAADLLTKLRMQLPYLLAHFPLASINLAALAGALWACARREALAACWALLALGTTLAAALTVPNGRYLVPLAPATIALGACAFANHGGRLRLPGLLLVLAAPLLPAFPPDAVDVDFQRQLAAALRAGVGAAAEAAPEASARAACLVGRPLVVADSAPQLAWEADAVVIAAPASRRDFWTIVERFPVRFARLRRFGTVSREELETRFQARPECGPDLFERRGAPAAPP